MPNSDSALLTDLYQLNMLAAYLDYGLTETAVFELFVRKLPPRRGFLIAAGLEQALQFLETLAFTSENLAAICGLGEFSDRFIGYLRSFRFTGDVDAMPEGTVFFPDEPIVRVTAPLSEAQFVETRLVNLLHFQTVIASKAARMVLAAEGKPLIDYGLRRAHGAEAGVLESDGGTIFNRFRRGAEEEPEPGGLGLGLWIVKSIIERHGGTIGVARTAEGRTRFSITFPVEVSP